LAPLECKTLKNKAVTLLELFIVLVIIAVLAGIGIVGWQAAIEREHEKNAKIILKSYWQAEQSYFAWRNRYTSQWPLLEIDNPNVTDKFYSYDIIEATTSTLTIRATRKGTNTGFQIDRDGVITSF